MTRQAAFVRNVMIGREGLHRQVLLDIVEQAGGRSPRSYISTGNVTFDADDSAVENVTTGIEAGVARVIGRREGVYVRTVQYLDAVVADDPFAGSPFAEPLHRLVSFAKEPVVWPSGIPRTSARGDWAVFRISGRDVFAVTRVVDGRVQDPGGRVQKISGQRMTSRSWTTIERIVRDPR